MRADVSVRAEVAQRPAMGEPPRRPRSLFLAGLAAAYLAAFASLYVQIPGRAAAAAEEERREGCEGVCARPRAWCGGMRARPRAWRGGGGRPVRPHRRSPGCNGCWKRGGGGDVSVGPGWLSCAVKSCRGRPSMGRGSFPSSPPPLHTKGGPGAAPDPCTPTPGAP